MATVTAIIAGLRTFGTAAVGVLKLIPWQAWLLLIGFIFGMWFADSGRSLANLACGCRRGEPKPPKTLAYSVVGVPDGSHITVSYGVRQRREATVALFGVLIPDSVADAAHNELVRLVGSSVNLQEALPEPVKAAEATEAIRPPPAVCYAFRAWQLRPDAH